MEKVNKLYTKIRSVANKESFVYAFLFIVCAFTIVSYVFMLDVFCAFLYAGLGIFVIIFRDDFLPISALFIYGYIFSSRENNPGRNSESIFSLSRYGIAFIVVLSVMAICLIIRLIKDKKIGFNNRSEKCGKLTFGFLFLSLSFLLSGLIMEEYSTVVLKNLLFALVEIFAFFGLYIIMSKCVFWEKIPKHFFSYLLVSVGITVSFQLFFTYLSNEVIVNGSINRDEIYTGWGMYNNIGAVIAVCIPSACYLSTQKKYGFIYNALSTFFLLAVTLTCSRTSMLFAFISYVVSAIFVLIKSKNKAIKKANLITYIITLSVAIIILIIFRDYLINVYHVLIERGLNLSGRETVYKTAFDIFKNHPIFGGSFYSSQFAVVDDFWYWSEEAFKSIFPVRWHNSVLQVMASCGTVGLIAYIVHRVQTVKLLIKPTNTENLFTAICVFMIIAISLLDCMLFNIGPGFIYSFALIYIEKSGRRNQ